MVAPDPAVLAYALQRGSPPTLPPVRGAVPDREIHLSARRQRAGRRRLSARHALPRQASRQRLRDLAVRRGRRADRTRDLSERAPTARSRRGTVQHQRRARRRVLRTRDVGPPRRADAPPRHDRPTHAPRRRRLDAGYCFDLRSSMSWGTTLCTLSTKATSATEKIGASPSLFTATMLSL